MYNSTQLMVFYLQVRSKIMYNNDHPEFNQELRLGLRVSEILKLGENWGTYFRYFWNAYIDIVMFTNHFRGGI